ncbi:polysaccharide export-related periplasmic protein [Prochlorococcus marinus str. MIT 9202]|nr:polysaccharide export-related periplasmic protein [Prochlorococcus marinus str. MIT 9202]
MFLKFNYKLNFLIFSAFAISSIVLPNKVNSNINITVEESHSKQTSPSLNYLKKIPKNDYIIGAGDQLNIVISKDYPELTRTEVVDGEGTIYLNKLNRIFVEGLTISELNKLLNDAFDKYIKFPSPEVKVLKYRPISIFIDGEVDSPGLYTLDGAISVPYENSSKEENILSPSTNDINPGLNKFEFLADNNTKDLDLNKIETTTSSIYFPTIFDGIRQAGGFTAFSNISEIEVIRKNNLTNGGGYLKTTLNFENLMKNGDNSQNIRIYDEDTILVKKNNIPNSELLSKAIKSNINPRFINVNVLGRVKKPGYLSLSKSSTLNDAIRMAGGPQIIKGKIVFIRYKNDGTIDKRNFKYSKNSRRGSLRNPFLNNNDLIFIDENFFTVSAAVINSVTSPFTGLLSTYGLIKAVED